ncbi:single-stranded-DNA-specific exonuclease RecJ [Campylobacter sp. MIT 99-7217]|uniref:single-stranded-DNA-specific exonuclease RecJ n=1 Tax=Campylobacter sp. MIT 99-7217 TaxID=535091 RepID=UPI00115A458E|nr:single-stranded-DNA-specific exonuclease RecJ [Campylobacter sp. MIT 99-7217]TQR28784.1 single-stranded-DNA-specific exonuclease RecJ [Campylobacter sp. MIT 99-7217]
MLTLSKKDIFELLQKRFEKDHCFSLCDLPLPSCFKDIFKASNRIKKAIEQNEKVAIVGDYDVDGVISCVILSEFFDDIGFDYVVKIPNRFKDGYGLNTEIVQDLINNDIKLIITVDNGMAATEAAKLCKEKNIDLIITDHHMPLEVLPEAFAIINPKQADCNFPKVEICGAEVAWYLVAGIKSVCKLKYDMCKFIDLLAIAIVADMMELRDLNRALVKQGLKNLNLSKRPAFKAIKSHFQKDKFEFDHIGFLIAPLLNSAGRMDDASLSYKFLHTKDLNEAQIYLKQIINFNENRKEEEKNLFEECLEQIKEEDHAIIVSKKGWHEGVLGIVASRLARHFNKPAFVFSEFDDKAKGSARSVGKIDILALIESQRELLMAFGGHKGAAGLTIEQKNLELFKKNIDTICKEFKEEDFLNTEEILGELDPKDVDFELLELLENFEPYGHKNPRPFFKLNKIIIKNIKTIGKDEKHFKLILTHQNLHLEALYFNCDKQLDVGSEVSCIASVSKNSFRGLITPQLIIKELCSI